MVIKLRIEIAEGLGSIERQLEYCYKDALDFDSRRQITHELFDKVSSVTAEELLQNLPW